MIAATEPATLADPVEVFMARSSARAHLWAEGDIQDLLEAVDKLQADAVRDGLVAKLGQDHVQHIVGAAFRAVRERAAFLIVAETPEPPQPSARARCAAQCTVEALVYALRQRGTAALAEWVTRRRLADLSTKQVREVIARLIALRPSYRIITDELIYQLGEQL